MGMMRRDRRSALWALGLAGAAYLWRNRDRLQQQLRGLQNRQAPRQLPDWGSGEQRQESTGQTERWTQPPGRFGGTEV
jgi:hypothetical protein